MINIGINMFIFALINSSNLTLNQIQLSFKSDSFFNDLSICRRLRFFVASFTYMGKCRMVVLFPAALSLFPLL